MNSIGRFDNEIEARAGSILREAYRNEIERAVANVKRTAWDRWRSRQWYRAAAQRRWHCEKEAGHAGWHPDVRGVPWPRRSWERDELRKQGYEFDHEYGSAEDRTEMWVNREIGRGIAIEWFRLPEAAR